jgi:thiamine pyrophosphokinase
VLKSLCEVQKTFKEDNLATYAVKRIYFTTPCFFIGDWKMNKRCVIFSGAPECAEYRPEPGDYVIAADSGYKHLVNAGLLPDLIAGDFDSFEGEIPADIPVLRVSSIKDDTDTMLAAKHALEQGYKDFLILGATGGRLDHQTANLVLCAYIAEKGGSCEIRGIFESVYSIKNGTLSLKKRENRSVSVFSFTDKSCGVSLRGLKYTLENATLTNIFPLGVSNEFSEERAEIAVKDGILIVICSQTAH